MSRGGAWTDRTYRPVKPESVPRPMPVSAEGGGDPVPSRVAYVVGGFLAGAAATVLFITYGWQVTICP